MFSFSSMLASSGRYLLKDFDESLVDVRSVSSTSGIGMCKVDVHIKARDFVENQAESDLTL